MAILWIDDINQIQKPSTDDGEVSFVLNLEKYTEDLIPQIVSSFKELVSQNYIVSLSIDANQRNFDAHEIAIFTALEKALNEIGVTLSFANQHENYTLKELITADNILDAFINDLKASNLSPFEKFLAIYNYLTDKQYSDDEERKHASRDLIAIINGSNIVCEGYAELMQYLCTNIGIKAICQQCYVHDKDGITNHMNNLVRIEDDKYNIHGYYYCDATWDSNKDLDQPKQYSFCLVPLPDFKCINTEIVLFQPFPIYYRYFGHFNELFDGFYQVLIGGNDYFDPDEGYRYVYKPGFLEEEFGLYDLMEESYDNVLKTFIERGKTIAQRFIKILKSLDVPSDIYSLYQVKVGFSFEYLFATLFLKDENEEYVVKCLKHIMQNRESWNQIDAYFSTWPHSSIEDVYELLNDIVNLNFNMINIPIEEFDKLTHDNSLDYPTMIAIKSIFRIIEKLRLFYCYKQCRPYIEEQTPIGKVIPQEAFISALKAIFQYQQALNIKPEDPRALKSLSWSYYTP